MDRKRKFMAAEKAIKRARAYKAARRPIRLPTRSVWTARGADELKTIDSTVTSNVPAAGNISTLNAVATGTDFTNRTGRKTTMKSLLLRLTLNPLPATSAPSGDAVRIVVLYDTQTNGAIPVVGDVLSGGTWDSPINLTNRDRFKILMDKQVNMAASTYTAGALTAGSPETKFLKKYRQFSLETIFNGTAGSVTQIQTGGLFILYISEANNVTNLLINSRVRFTDA